MAKTKVAVLFGGVSSEHEVSRVSAAAIVDHIPAHEYDVVKIGITKRGRWLLYPGGTDEMRDGTWSESPDCVPAILSPDRLTHGMVLHHGTVFDAVKLDLVFPVLHGRNGEDGTVQGLLDLSGIPYVGCGVLSSAACMDKATTCKLLERAGIPHAAWVEATREEVADFDSLLPRLLQKLQYPIFVKPSVGGSSVGITKTHNADELRSAAALAGAHDKKILFEQGITGQEVECAVLGNKELIATLPGEIISCNEIYDYAAKYETGDASRLLIPADLPPEKLEEVRALALRAYRELGCEGLARVDSFVEKGTGRVFLNEINTLPGFTPISMYPKLLEADGISFSQLVCRLMELALQRAEE